MSEEECILEIMEGLQESFSNMDLDRWLSYFNSEHAFVLHNSVLISDNRDSTKSTFSPMMKALKEAGFVRSLLDMCNIKMLGNEQAVVSAKWRRLDGDDNLINTLSDTYTFIRAGSGWKIAVVVIHDSDETLVV